MFIKVTSWANGDSMLVNTDYIYCVIEVGRKSRIDFTDDTELLITESFNEVEQMLKGADDEQHND